MVDRSLFHTNAAEGKRGLSDISFYLGGIFKCVRMRGQEMEVRKREDAHSWVMFGSDMVLVAVDVM